MLRGGERHNSQCAFAGDGRTTTFSLVPPSIRTCSYFSNPPLCSSALRSADSRVPQSAPCFFRYMDVSLDKFSLLGHNIPTSIYSSSWLLRSNINFEPFILNRHEISTPVPRSGRNICLALWKCVCGHLFAQPEQCRLSIPLQFPVGNVDRPNERESVSIQPYFSFV